MIINLENPLECSELCKIVQKTIDKYIKETGLQAKAISIKVVDIVDSENTPKLEHKNEDNNPAT